MSSAQLFRLSGAALALGGLVSLVAYTLTSLLFPNQNDPTYAANRLYAPLYLLGFAGAMLLLLGLPGLAVEAARRAGLPGLLGVVLIAIAGAMFGVFFTLLQAIIFPYLAEQAPQIIAADEGPPGLFPFFVFGTLASVVGSILLALPLLRGRLRPRGAGYALVAAAALSVVSFFLETTGSPMSSLSTLVDLLSTDLLFVALGWLGAELYTGRLGHVN
jgi:hypothetical protein